jgi:O-antigen/teichoic acid export membrane protein
MSDSDHEGYGGRAISGAAWTGITAVGIRLLRTAVFLLLARLLVPEAFGIVALAMVFVSILQHLTGQGFTSYIIQSPRLTTEHLDTAFWVNLLTGTLLAVALASSSVWLANVFDAPELIGVLLALSVLPLLSGLSSVPEGLLNRDMEFRWLSTRSLVAAGVSTAVSLTLALLGAGVWALVAQTLIEATLSCAMLWWAGRRLFRPGRRVSGPHFITMTRYGVKITGGELMQVASTKGDDFLIGAFLGTQALGLYSVAYRLLTVLQEALHGATASVSFAVLSRLQGERERLLRAFSRSAGVVATIALPAFFGTAILAPTIVPVALGDQWSKAIPVVAVLSVAGAAATAVDANQVLLGARGRPGLALTLSTLSALLNLVGFLIAVRHGILWVAVALAARAYLVLPVSFYLVWRETGFGAREFARIYAPVLCSVTVPCAAAWGVQRLTADVPAFVTLVIALLVCVPAYAVALRVIARERWDDMRTLIETLWSKTRTSRRATVDSSK